MSTNTPRDWLKGKQTATAMDLSNDIWVRIEHVNRVLERYGRGNFIENMPPLFAMYYYAVVTVMKIPEEPTGMELQKIYYENVRNLADECLIGDDEAEGMIARFHSTCQKLADAYVAEKTEKGEDFNPFTPIVHATSREIGLDYGDINVALAQHLADFAVSYQVKV